MVGRIGRKHRILVVDDYPDAAEVASTLLGLLGHECLAVHSGEQALDAIGAFDPTIAIIDISLPGISGYDVARAIRTGITTRQVRLVALTGWQRTEDPATALAAGFDEFVLKPADAAKLRGIVDRADGLVADDRDTSRAPNH